MDEKLVARINELAKKKKSEGLTDAEVQEQQELRAKYLRIFREGVHSHLLNMKVVDPEGTDVTPKKLKKAQKEHRHKN